MHVEYMLLTGAEFSYENVLYLMSIKAFNGHKTTIYQSRYGILVICGFDISKEDYNKLYKEMIKKTGAKHIDSRFYEK